MLGSFEIRLMELYRTKWFLFNFVFEGYIHSNRSVTRQNGTCDSFLRLLKQYDSNISMNLIPPRRHVFSNASKEDSFDYVEICHSQIIDNHISTGLE